MNTQSATIGASVNRIEGTEKVTGETRFTADVIKLMDCLGDKYQIDELAGKYDFTGRQGMTIEEALEIKEELEKIDRLLEQLEQARETAQVGVVDLSELSEFAEPGDVENLNRLHSRSKSTFARWPKAKGSIAATVVSNSRPRHIGCFKAGSLRRRRSRHR